MPTSRKVVTIDGPSGSGKSTLSKLLAEKLGFVHLNTGSIYRTVAYLALSHNVDCSDEQKVVALLKGARIELKLGSQGSAEVFLNGKMLGDEIRTSQVSEGTSKVAALPKVRAALKDTQRNAFPGSNLIAEGRDMGTVIFPDANLKFYIEVDEATRIRRRLAQFEKKEPGTFSGGDKLLKEQMKIEIEERDRRDRERAVAPLKPADDAVIIDNSSKTLTETVETMYHHAAQRGLSLR